MIGFLGSLSATMASAKTLFSCSANALITENDAFYEIYLGGDSFFGGELLKFSSELGITDSRIDVVGVRFEKKKCMGSQGSNTLQYMNCGWSGGNYLPLTFYTGFLTTEDKLKDLVAIARLENSEDFDVDFGLEQVVVSSMVPYSTLAMTDLTPPNSKGVFSFELIKPTLSILYPFRDAIQFSPMRDRKFCKSL